MILPDLVFLTLEAVALPLIIMVLEYLFSRFVSEPPNLIKITDPTNMALSREVAVGVHPSLSFFLPIVSLGIDIVLVTTVKTLPLAKSTVFKDWEDSLQTGLVLMGLGLLAVEILMTRYLLRRQWRDREELVVQGNEIRVGRIGLKEKAWQFLILWCSIGVAVLSWLVPISVLLITADLADKLLG